MARRRDGACAVVLLGLALTISLHVAGGQERGLSVGPAAALGEKSSWEPCTAVTVEFSTAIQSAQTLFEQLWLANDRGHFAAYTMPGEKRNPFDLTPPTPDSGPRDGLVQAQAPFCLINRGEGNVVSVRFVTRFYRFYEAGHGWSAPLRDGLMLEAAVILAGTDWQARDTASERSILLPEQTPRRADAATLPAETGWAEPMPGCGKRLRWDGKDCVSRKR